MASGLLGVVNGMSTVEQWNITESKTSDTYVASNTLQGTQRSGGIRSWSGSFNGRGDTPPVMPGEEFSFLGQSSATGGGGNQYFGNAICNQITMTWDWATNTILAYSVQFVGQLGLEFLQDGELTDATIPYVGATCGTKVEYATDIAPTVFIELPAITTATLTITSALATEANSSTVDDGCWTTASPGPIDWGLSLGQEDDMRGVSGYPELGLLNLLKIYTSATEFWLLKFAIQQDYSNLTVDINTGATVSRNLNFAMSASDGTTMGQILRPADVPTSPWWGLAEAP